QFDAYFHSTKHLIAFVQSRFYAKQVFFTVPFSVPSSHFPVLPTQTFSRKSLIFSLFPIF
ncbi:TPA: hypothetical protein ACPORJ_001737, partial [Haemophilus influenzae]